MAVRKIIRIDQQKCDGCGLCVPSCAEGAIVIIDGKAKVIEDKYCDGLGACLGECPKDALSIIEREADEFDEEAVKELLERQNKKEEQQKQTDCGCSGGSHGHHGHHHSVQVHKGGGCPGSRTLSFDNKQNNQAKQTISAGDIEISIKPQLQQWPVQLMLVPPTAPYLKGADLLITADCVAVAYPNYQLDLLKGRRVVMGCPKLDDIELYVERLTEMININNLKSVTVAYMEVPCCMGIVRAVDRAAANARVGVEINKVKIGVHGDRQ